MPLSIPKKRSLWDLALLVLGFNIWVLFLILPIVHLTLPHLSRTTLVLIGVAPLALVLGVLFRHGVTLLAVFPLLLVVPVAVTPQLVGVNVLSTWTFCLVTLSFLAYLLGTLLILRGFRAPPVPDEGRDLGPFEPTPRWRRRRRIYIWMAAMAGLFPAVLIYVLFLHPGVQANLAASYPTRAGEATAFFGVLALALWLGVFYADFLAPLRAHVRGDPRLHYDIEQIRRSAQRRQVRPSFFVFVAIALGLMVALFLVRG
jgi:hypothetical protein